MRKLKCYIVIILLYAPVCAGAYYCGYEYGIKKAFEDIILDRCWLNKQSRDIECIQYIAD